MNITELWKGCQVLVQSKSVKERAKIYRINEDGTLLIMPLYGADTRVVTPEQIIKKFD
jgi:hypothetical protein